MARREVSGSRVLLTGASSGIGRALALELARCGARQVIVARRVAKLEEVEQHAREQGREVHVFAGDVTEAGVRRDVLAFCRDRMGGLDVLINNAGVGGLGRFDEATEDRLRSIMELNLFAAAELIREGLPLRKQGTTPLIVNVGSILGHRGVPMLSEYCASKFAMKGLSESLRAELSHDGIDVLLVSPGTTRTDFYDNTIGGRQQLPWPEQQGVPAEVVARDTVRAMRKGKHEIVPNFRGKLLIWLNRLMPRFVDRWMARYGR